MPGTSAAGAARLLLRLRSQRFFNQFSRAATQEAESPGRVGVARKRGPAGVVVLIMAIMGVSFQTLIASLVMVNMTAMLGPVDSRAFLDGVTLLITLMTVAVLCINIGTRDSGGADSELEWLVTLPVPVGVLIAGRFIERTLINPAGLMLLAPILCMFAWHAGLGFWAIPIGLGLTLGLLMIVAPIRTLIDTGLRLSWTASRLRNLQAASSVVAALILLPLSIIGFRQDRFMFYDWVDNLPAWTRWLPGGTAVDFVTRLQSGGSWGSLAMFLAQIVAVIVACALLLRWQLRNGVVAGGMRDSGRDDAPRLARERGTTGRGWGPLVARELKLLSRDRNFMTQVLIVPLLLGGSIYLLNADRFPTIHEQPAAVAALAFWVGALVLMASALKALSLEGSALWMMYTFPHSLESMLWQKTLVWTGVAGIFVLTVLLVPVVASGAWSPLYLELSGIALIGVPLYAMVGTALGVLSSNPLASDVRQQVRRGYTPLFTVLSGMYSLAIYTTTTAKRASLVVITAALAVSLWQRAVDRLPYVTDPDAAPPSRVAASDGLVAIIGIFAVQGLFAMAMLIKNRQPDGELMHFIGNVATLIVGVAVYAILRQLGRVDLPAFVAGSAVRAVGWGAAAGVAAAGFAVAYLALAPGWGLQVPELAQLKQSIPFVLLIAVTLLTPFCAELIFRGLIFGGLRRTFGVGIAIAGSTAVFVAVQPGFLAVPALALGVLAALAYLRSGALLAPILVHAIYGVAILLFRSAGA